MGEIPLHTGPVFLLRERTHILVNRIVFSFAGSWERLSLFPRFRRLIEFGASYLQMVLTDEEAGALEAVAAEVAGARGNEGYMQGAHESQ